MRKALVAVLVCSLSTTALADDEITPPGLSRITTTEAEATPIESTEPAPVAVAPDPSARKPAIIWTAIAGALVIATVGIYYHREGHATVNLIGTVAGTCNDACRADREHTRELIEREKKLYVGVAIGAVIAGGVAGYLWTKATERTFKRAPRVTVGTDGQSASLGFHGSF
jgi:hypothetical protein